MGGRHNISAAAAASTLDAARDYLRRGWAVIPIPHSEKARREKDWPNLRLSESDLTARFSNGENIGVLLGETQSRRSVNLNPQDQPGDAQEPQ